MSFKFSPLQEEFLTLLETTDQPQTRNTLCNAEGFCCLGLWTVHRGVKPIPASYLDNVYDSILFENGERYNLSNKLRAELGFKANSLDPRISLGSRHVADLNDSGKSFKEIASIIRKNPERVFIEETQ